MSDKPKPLVSIGMTVYNQGPFLVKTIVSLLNQNYRNFELIISDNASNDQSQEICQHFAKHDKRIQFIQNSENIGANGNTAKVLDAISGEFYMFASGHDLYHPNFIERLVNCFSSKGNKVIMAYSDAVQIDMQGNCLQAITEDIDTCNLSAADRFKKVMWNLTWCTPVYGLYRASVFKSTWRMYEIIGPDRVFMPELSLKGAFAHYKEPLFFWRQNRPVEEHTELEQRQAKMFVNNQIEALAPVTMRDYELLQVVNSSLLDEHKKQELLHEVFKWHHSLPFNKTYREARNIHHKGTKLLNSKDVSVEDKIEAAKNYLRVADILRIFCKTCNEQLDQLSKLCRQYINGDFELHTFDNVTKTTSQNVKTGSKTDGLIPPEIINDAFYEDIKRLAAQKGVKHVLEIGSSAGEGSTSAFVAGIKAGGNEAKLYCLEISKRRNAQLKKRYACEENVLCYRDSSIPLYRFPSEKDVVNFYQSTPTTLNRYPIDQVLGWLRQDKENVAHSDVPGNGIKGIKHGNGIHDFDIVLIDGSEFTGHAELEDIYGAKIIMLDDINSYKNYNNYQRLKNDPAYQLEKENWRLRNGYAIFRRIADGELPMHFFTIVLNGEPFIRYHLELFKQLDTPWHWHIIEGVADLKHDTAWSVANGGRIDSHFHSNGFSIDGTGFYLDAIAAKYPDQVTLYRKPNGELWGGKREMVSAPLTNLPDDCLLWQIDVDEIWRVEQIRKVYKLFNEHPERTAAFFHCHFFVGPELLTISPGQYSHNDSYEWIRVWRYHKGMQWKSHEPPCLMTKINGRWHDTAQIKPFVHKETETAGLVFTHHAYSLESHVRFKESYYGYRNATASWRKLQQAQRLPLRLGDYLPWVKDDCRADHMDRRIIGKDVPPVRLDEIIHRYGAHADAGSQPHIVIDGVIFQLQANHPQGVSRVWSNLIPELRHRMTNAKITVLQRKGFPIPFEDADLEEVPVYRLGNSKLLDKDDEMLRKVCSDLKADLFISTYYTRAPGVTNLVMMHDMIPERRGFDLTHPEWAAKQRAIETADAFICVSQATQTDLIEVYPQVAKRPMKVAYNGLDPCFRAPSRRAVEQLRSRLKLDGPYVMLVGNRHGYKSGETALKTLARLECNDQPTVLCVGGETQLSPVELRLKDKLDIRYVGRLEDQALVAAYGGAQALLVPSQHEGFGLPVIEAMACGCPVIAHPSAAVAEVGADVVYYADMNSAKELRAALRKISQKGSENERIQKGYERSKRFNWLNTAQSFEEMITALVERPAILLTAIVSTYNAAQFIGGCLEDLENQTIADRLEIIVVDSASEQDEASVVRDFQARRDNIKYMRTPVRESVYQAWNRGIKVAQGKYITNANTDDRHRKDAFEQMVGVMEADESIALVYADVIKTRTANETFRDCTPAGMYRWHDWDRSTLLEKGCFIGPQPVWRKSVHQDYGYFNINYEISADFEFWLRISQTCQFYHIPKPLGLYMDRPDSVEHANMSKKQQEDQAIIQRYRHAAAENILIGIPSDTGHHLKSDRFQKKHGVEVDKAQNVQCMTPANEASIQGGHDMISLESIFKAIKQLVDSGHKEAALWAMGKLLVDFPENAQLHSEMAALAYEQADMKKAMAHFKQAAKLEPQNLAYLKNLGDFYYVVEKDAERALAQYKRLLNVDPTNIEALIMAGHVSTSLHRYSHGQQFYQRALDLDPQNMEVRQLLEKMNQPSQDQSSSAMSVDELYTAAEKKALEDDRDSAISLLEQLLAQDDTHALAHNDLGVLQYESGNLQAALTHYEKAVGLQPENETFQKNLADLYLAAMGDHEKALRAYVQVLKLNPRDVEAMLGCGQISMSLGKVSDARDFFNTVLKLEPWNEDAKNLLRQLEQTAALSDPAGTDLYGRAKIKASEGDLQGAINDLNLLVVQSPNNANIFNDLGVLYFETGDKDKALEFYEQAVNLDPSDNIYRKNLADFYLIEQERAEEAMKLYLMVLEEDPMDIEALIASGMICAVSAKVEDAKFFYQRVLEIEPWNEIAQNALNELNPNGEGGRSESTPSAATG